MVNFVLDPGHQWPSCTPVVYIHDVNTLFCLVLCTSAARAVSSVVLHIRYHYQVLWEINDVLISNIFVPFIHISIVRARLWYHTIPCVLRTQYTGTVWYLISPCEYVIAATSSSKLWRQRQTGLGQAAARGAFSALPYSHVGTWGMLGKVSQSH